MDDDSNNAELTIEELIELELCGIEAVIETVGPGEPVFIEVRNRLVNLLHRLVREEVAAEYAEIELLKIRKLSDQWSKDHPLPPDWND